MSGLTERERRLLEEGRQYAATMMALERERLAKQTERDAERRAKAEQDTAEHRARFGPREIVGPDGVRVTLWVERSGWWGVGGFAVGDLIAIVVGFAVVVLANLFSHFVAFRGGSTLHITAPGRKKMKVRLRSQAAAAQRLREVAEAVRRDGVPALETARRRSGTLPRAH
jgi:hypothetical protein